MYTINHSPVDRQAQRIAREHLYLDLDSGMSEFNSDPDFEYHVPGISISEIADLYTQVEEDFIVSRWPKEVQVWVVSDWLAYRLISHGERVQRILGQNLWSRENTGESIYKDAVIQEIASGNYDYKY